MLVSSYLTVSPLPAHGPAVCFLWHCPAGRPGLPLTTTLLCGVRAILPTSLVGTAGGCALLLLTPARAFELVVPFLVLGAAATLAFQERLRGLVGHPRTMSEKRAFITLQVVVFVGAIYGGYFGA